MTLTEWRDARTSEYARFHGAATQISKMLGYGGMNAQQAASALADANERLERKFAEFDAALNARHNAVMETI